MKLLTQTYEHHREVPEVLWQNLHSLFKIARQKKFTQKSLKKIVEWNGSLNTLEDIYKYCLLFVMTNPYQLRHEEIIQLMYALEFWVPLMKLQREDKKDNQLFLVDLNKPVAAHYKKQCTEISEDCYYLNIEKLLDHLAKLRTHIKLGGGRKNENGFSDTELSLPLHFIQALIYTLSSFNVKQHTKQKLHGFVVVTLGMLAGYTFLKRKSQTTLQEKNMMVDNSGSVETINISLLPPALCLSENELANYEQYNCELVDQSEEGYCLKWIQQIPDQLKCGEIIVLEEEVQNRQRCALGTIRWLRNEASNEVFLGVQILSQEILPVKARLLDQEDSQSIFTFLLAEHAGDNKPVTLLTPSLPFKSDQDIEIEFNGKTYKACLTKSESFSRSYQEFELQFTAGCPPFCEWQNVAVEALSSGAELDRR